ncbi:MAG: hypothetical protein NT105_17780 [Verrucomicrobia bacterium]|nr:hypothetical protein [Verrucomicrobiota bacterium]
MVNLYDILTLIYGVVGFVIGWLWGRHRSTLASFIASVIAATIGFGVGSSLGWLSIFAESYTDKLAQHYKLLGSSAGLVFSILWFVVIIAIPVFAVAVFRKADRRAVAELQASSHRSPYR